MNYKVSDLSKILDISSNTVRRYEGMGYLSPDRMDANGYRVYGAGDVTKMIIINNYRKLGFSHAEIAKIFKGSYHEKIELYEERLAAMDKELELLSGLRHMLKDDLALMKKIEAVQDGFYQRDCVPMNYVLYSENGELLKEDERLDTIQKYFYNATELRYIYIFKKGEIEQGIFNCNEGIAVKDVHMERFGLKLNEYTGVYEKKPSIMKIVKLPLNFSESGQEEKDRLFHEIFDDVLQYIKENGYVMDGDVIGIKISMSLEEETEAQYVLISIPFSQEASAE
ncbi:MAG: MerR family transcriptional regulator [Lachnospiraceae bacterium]|nr:MerR family transcriptional regulator [Lachnospiraceae bacterium]